jgi:hypothetical protein
MLELSDFVIIEPDDEFVPRPRFAPTLQNSSVCNIHNILNSMSARETSDLERQLLRKLKSDLLSYDRVVVNMRPQYAAKLTQILADLRSHGIDHQIIHDKCIIYSPM